MRHDLSLNFFDMYRKTQACWICGFLIFRRLALQPNQTTYLTGGDIPAIYVLMLLALFSLYPGYPGYRLQTILVPTRGLCALPARQGAKHFPEPVFVNV
jgi:hypothetical protein